ncbi:hypothetical protein BpHYR1_016527 [Brachionus plicatilis]|uniref:Uncharacterized protein n=1 Tax=Brachionus plicatilis TaxID=10195 RepID=A0A3M7R7V4_BRAPC|nr:hypothetical protein BpHYR1_016527 [Brachionus plicatilis]
MGFELVERNALPTSVVTASSINQFKNRLDNVEAYYCVTSTIAGLDSGRTVLLQHKLNFNVSEYCAFCRDFFTCHLTLTVDLTMNVTLIELIFKIEAKQLFNSFVTLCCSFVLNMRKPLLPCNNVRSFLTHRYLCSLKIESKNALNQKRIDQGTLKSIGNRKKYC